MRTLRLHFIVAISLSLITGCDAAEETSSEAGPPPGEPVLERELPPADSLSAETVEDLDVTPAGSATDSSPSDDTSTPEDTSGETSEVEEDAEEESGPQEWGPTLCVDTEEKGYEIGEILANMQFLSCDGDAFGTQELCGASATWLFIVHAWCAECRKVPAFADAIAEEYAAQNVAVVQILVHSYDHQLPTSSDCEAWVDEFQLKTATTLYDPVVKNILLAISQQTGLSVFLDADQRIISKEHFYMEGPIRAEIDAILDMQ